MRFIQPFDGRTRVPVLTPQPIGYRVFRSPRSDKLWTFCERKANAMVALNTLREQGYHKARVEPLYLD